MKIKRKRKLQRFSFSLLVMDEKYGTYYLTITYTKKVAPTHEI